MIPTLPVKDPVDESKKLADLTVLDLKKIVCELYGNTHPQCKNWELCHTFVADVGDTGKPTLLGYPAESGNNPGVGWEPFAVNKIDGGILISWRRDLTNAPRD